MTKEDNIKTAYRKGYSRRQIAEIFGVSQRKVITLTATSEDKEAHIAANKEANVRLNKAVKGWKYKQYEKTGKIPSAKAVREKRKRFVKQRLKAAEGAWGEIPVYVEESDTFRTYLEIENEGDEDE